MTTLKFKTTINCGGCIAKVTPFLNQVEGINKWDVETTNPQKILTVETEKPIQDEIIKGLSQLGYKAEAIN
jgi:copper chaperone